MVQTPSNQLITLKDAEYNDFPINDNGEGGNQYLYWSERLWGSSNKQTNYSNKILDGKSAYTCGLLGSDYSGSNLCPNFQVFMNRCNSFFSYAPTLNITGYPSNMPQNVYYGTLNYYIPLTSVMQTWYFQEDSYGYNVYLCAFQTDNKGNYVVRYGGLYLGSSGRTLDYYTSSNNGNNVYRPTIDYANSRALLFSTTFFGFTTNFSPAFPGYIGLFSMSPSQKIRAAWSSKVFTISNITTYRNMDYNYALHPPISIPSEYSGNSRNLGTINITLSGSQNY